MKNIVKYIIPVFIICISISCSDFLDINKDKNNPTDARLDQLLLTPQIMIFDAFGNGPGGISDLASQYIHHTVQRGPQNFYFMDGNEFAISTAWGNIYNGALEDLNIIIDKAGTVGANNYLGIAKLLKAYTYSMTVDTWGVSVFSEFGKGSANFFPHYDKGEDVYNAVFTLIDEAKSDLAKPFPATLAITGGQDQIYGGDVLKWIKFANTLKLKLYNQVRLTNLYDAAKVAALLTENNFISKGSEGFRLLYTSSNTPENRNPMFVNDYVSGNPANYIDPYFYLVMKGDGTLYPLLAGIEDPRIPYYFYNQLATGEAPQNKFAYKNGNFLSIWFASFNIDPNEGFDQSNSQTLPGLYPSGGAYDDSLGVNRGVNSGLKGAAYQRFISYHTHLYTRAELALTMVTTEDPAALLGDAITASFDEVNEAAALAGVPVIRSSSITSYKTSILNLFNAASTTDAKLELLMTQKWIASFGFGLDSYSDYRRTGFPVMFDPATDNNPVTVLNRNYPVSFPLNAFDVKSNPNAPTNLNPGTSKIFWDIN